MNRIIGDRYSGFGINWSCTRHRLCTDVCVCVKRKCVLHVVVNRFGVNQLEFVVCACAISPQERRSSLVSCALSRYSRQLWTTAQQIPDETRKKKKTDYEQWMTLVWVLLWYNTVRATTLLFVCAICEWTNTRLSFIYSTLAPLARSDLNIVSQFVFWILQERKYKFSVIWKGKKRNQWNFVWIAMLICLKLSNVWKPFFKIPEIRREKSVCELNLNWQQIKWKLCGGILLIIFILKTKKCEEIW